VRPSALAAALVVLASGCVPYAVGTTAATVPERQVEPSAVVQVASARRDLDDDDEPSGPSFSLGNEARLGLDARSDVGLRLTGFGGVTATYKRRLSGAGENGTAFLVGAGVVGASHVHTEATLVVSRAAFGGPLGRQLGGRVAPYGGVRVQDLEPFAEDALDTQPAVGLFAGARLGWPDLGLSPEVGVVYSPSPLSGDRRFIVVPSVTVRGDRLRRALGL
jgi:hypothetical protein